MKYKDKILELSSKGLTQREIALNIGCADSTVSYHLHPKQKKKAIEAGKRRRRERKEMAVEYKGGKCERCGYDKCMGALDFHHKNPEEKEFILAHASGWEKMKEELGKCTLLCKNCHYELHNC